MKTGAQNGPSNGLNAWGRPQIVPHANAQHISPSRAAGNVPILRSPLERQYHLLLPGDEEWMCARVILTTHYTVGYTLQFTTLLCCVALF